MITAIPTRRSDAILAALNYVVYRATVQTIIEIELEAYTPQEYAYAGLEIVSRHLKNGTAHYRNADGELLVTLDQFVQALIDGELA